MTSMDKYDRIMLGCFTVTIFTFTVAIVVIASNSHSTFQQSNLSNVKSLKSKDVRSTGSPSIECDVRSTESPSIEAGETYVRWGKRSCPEGAEVVYKGQVAGNAYNNKGGGVNYLCLPDDPENGDYQSFPNNALFGVEYQIFPGRQQPKGMSSILGNKEAPCAVCYRQRASAVLMIPGRKTCYEGWRYEYHGYLMSDNVVQSSKDYVCVDVDAQPLDTDKSDHNHALFVPIRTKCGSLRCPPYTDRSDVRCVVCTK